MGLPSWVGKCLEDAGGAVRSLTNIYSLPISLSTVPYSQKDRLIGIFCPFSLFDR